MYVGSIPTRRTKKKEITMRFDLITQQQLKTRIESIAKALRSRTWGYYTRERIPDMLKTSPEYTLTTVPLFNALLNNQFNIEYTVNPSVPDMVDLFARLLNPTSKPALYYINFETSYWQEEDSAEQNKLLPTIERIGKQAYIKRFKEQINVNLLEITDMVNTIMPQTDQGVTTAYYNKANNILLIAQSFRSQTYYYKIDTVHELLKRTIALAQFTIIPIINKDLTDYELKLIENVYKAIKDDNTNSYDEAVVEAYNLYKETLPYSNPLEELSKHLEEKNKMVLNQTLSGRKSDYDQLYNRIVQQASEIRSLEKMLNKSTISDINFDAMLTDLNAISELILLDIEQDAPGTSLNFYIDTFLSVDPDLVNANVLKKEKHLKFYKAIVENKIKVPVGQVIRLKIAPDQTLSLSVKGALETAGLPEQLQNPHLSRFNCFGSYNHEIQNAALTSNWYIITQLLIASVKQINLADNTVKDYFGNHDLEPGHFPILDTETGATTTWKEYYAKITNNK